MMVYPNQVDDIVSVETKTGMDAIRGGEKTLAALARHLGVTRGAVAQWERVPAERVIEISRFTGIPREVLRPDLYEDIVEAAE